MPSGSKPRTSSCLTTSVEAKLELLRELLERRSLRAVALTAADSVAWVTGGVTNRIEPGNPAGPLWIVVGPDTAAAVTTNVERARLEEEAELPFELHEAPWYEPGGLGWTKSPRWATVSGPTTEAPSDRS